MKPLFFILIQITVFTILSLESRSPFRKVTAPVPTITTQWKKNPDKGENPSYSRGDEYYNASPFFTIFNTKHFEEKLLPEKLHYADDPSLSISRKAVDELIETLYQEVREGKKMYAHFDILQTKNFNKRQQCGLLVVKFKEYPFVVKLFIENPKTLINPYCKGFENRLFHFMGHGASRHFAGFTRTANADHIKSIVALSEKWNGRVTLPRKWYWMPKDASWIDIKGSNFLQNTHEIITAEIPSVYAIIADQLNTTDMLSMSLFKKHQIVMDFCNDMQLQIDPHLTNFTLHLDETGELKELTLVDTEHFPTMVGIHTPLVFKNYLHWYGYLSIKALQDLYGQNKKERRRRLYATHPFPWQDIS